MPRIDPPDTTQVVGLNAAGAAPHALENPVLSGGIDGGGLKRAFKTNTLGRQEVILYDGFGNLISSRSYDSVRPLDVYMPQIGAQNATHTRFTINANINTVILAANPLRKWLRIENASGASFFMKFGTTAVVNQGIEIANNTSFIMLASALYLGAINVIVGSNNRTIEVIEGY